MKIGISGATGFVGSHLVRHFSKEGHSVQAYGRGKPPKELLNFAQYEQWDLSKPYENKFEGDIFIHCAAFVNLWGDYTKIKNVTVEGTKNSIQAAAEADHFIYLSSGSVYGSSDHKEPLVENTPYPEIYSNNYAKTKMEAEKFVVEKSSTFKRATIIRPHFIYGPNDRTLVPKLLRTVKFGCAFMIGDGTNKISPTHIGNLCKSLSLIINSNQKGLKIYNVTDEKSVSLNDTYKTLFDSFNLDVKVIKLPYFIADVLASFAEAESRIITSKTPLLTRDIAKQFTNNSVLSTKLINEDLGYEPSFKLNDGFSDLASWVESIGGLENYLKNYKSSTWEGKLITY